MDGIMDSMFMSLSKFWETVKDREAWCVVVHGVAEPDMTEQLSSSSSLGKDQNPKFKVEFLLNIYFF